LLCRFSDAGKVTVTAHAVNAGVIFHRRAGAIVHHC